MDEHTECPTCGHKGVIEKPFFDDKMMAAAFNGKMCHLTPVENEVFKMLYKRYPYSVSVEQFSSIWWSTDIDTNANIRSQICRLRKKLKPLGIEIINGVRSFDDMIGHYWLKM